MACNAHKDFVTSLERSLVIDGQKVKVKAGVSEEKDHVMGTKVSGFGNLRHAKRTQDRGYAINMTPSGHQLRTNYYKDNPPKCDPTNFTQDISTLT